MEAESSHVNVLNVVDKGLLHFTQYLAVRLQEYSNVLKPTNSKVFDFHKKHTKNSLMEVTNLEPGDSIAFLCRTGYFPLFKW